VKSTGNTRSGFESSRMAGVCAAVCRARSIAIMRREKVTTELGSCAIGAALLEG
jgi:hypothetical protein